MTATLKKAHQVLDTMPADRQEQVAQWIVDIAAQDNSAAQLTDEQVAEVERRMADPKPVFATDDQVAAIFGKYAV